LTSKNVNYRTSLQQLFKPVNCAGGAAAARVHAGAAHAGGYCLKPRVKV